MRKLHKPARSLHTVTESHRPRTCFPIIRPAPWGRRHRLLRTMYFLVRASIARPPRECNYNFRGGLPDFSHENRVK